jgi:hypothetical protein
VGHPSALSVVKAWASPYPITRNFWLLFSFPFGVVTITNPVVPETVVLISDLDTTVNFAAVPLKVTLVAPVRSVPRIMTAVPTLPEVGRVSTNGPSPTDKLKTVPSRLAPPPFVVPLNFPLVSWTSPA